MKKKFVFPTMLALAILTIGILATSVTAQSSQYPPVVQKIADKFNLDVSEVQEVFDEERDARRAEMFARFSDRLDELVSSGKLTISQKEAILDKHEEMRDKMEALKDLTPEERRDKKIEIHNEFRNWLKLQGIGENFLEQYGSKKGFGKGYKIEVSQ